MWYLIILAGNSFLLLALIDNESFALEVFSTLLDHKVAFVETKKNCNEGDIVIKSKVTFKIINLVR